MEKWGGVGGVAGRVDNGGSVTNCAALNSSVTRDVISASTDFGRVAGLESGGTLTNNAAWVNMPVIGATVSGGADDENGADMSLTDMSTGNGTLGGRFSAPDWTITVGKLPILTALPAGAQNDAIPAHIH